MRKKLLRSVGLAFMLFFAFPAAVSADDATKEVTTVEELQAAFNEANADPGSTYTISLQNDIVLSESGTSFSLSATNASVVLDGNGYSLSNVETIHVLNGAKLVLGDGDGDALTISGVTNSDKPGILHVNGSGSDLVMNDGVTLTGHTGNNYFGGGVTLTNSATFTMNGGTITDCHLQGGSVAFGGGVAVIRGSRFTMYGGTIEDCSVAAGTTDNFYTMYGYSPKLYPNSCGGGVYVSKSSVFTMNGGSVDGCDSSSHGGGVMLQDDQYDQQGNFNNAFTMARGASISNCEAPYGGGVSILGTPCTADAIGYAGDTPALADSEVVLDISGTISGNFGGDGGGIYVSRISRNGKKPTLNILNATITGNQATKGGALYVYSYWTKTKLESSVVDNNIVTNKGGAIYLENNSSGGRLDIVSSSIRNNESADMGGGIYYDSSSLVYLSGNNTIQGNITTKTGSRVPNNVNVLSYEKPVYVNGDLTGSQIGLSDPALWAGLADSAVRLTSGYDTNNANVNPSVVFTSDHEGWLVDYSTSPAGEARLVKGATITLDLQGGSYAEIPDGYSASENGTFFSNQKNGGTIPTPAVPARDGYTFDGWYTDAAGTTAYDFESTIDGDITLYAKWKAKPVTKTYTLKYETNGGTRYDDETYTSNTTVDLTKVPTREGYQFTGWYADQTLTKPIRSISMTENMTVYAGWRASTVPDMLNGADHFSYIIGYPDGTIRPTANVSRGEVAMIFFRLLKAETRDANLTSENTFTDVNDGDVCNKAVSTLNKLGIMKGRTATTFDPNAPITRAEFAAVCARFDTGVTLGASDFTDIDASWAKAEIERAVSLGWIRGYGDNTFRPGQNIIRAEAITMINRVLCRIPETEDDLLDGMLVWPDNNLGDVHYFSIQEATNSHEYKNKGEVYETWTKLTENPDWTIYQ